MLCSKHTTTTKPIAPLFDSQTIAEQRQHSKSTTTKISNWNIKSDVAINWKMKQLRMQNSRQNALFVQCPYLLFISSLQMIQIFFGGFPINEDRNVCALLWRIVTFSACLFFFIRFYLNSINRFKVQTIEGKTIIIVCLCGKTTMEECWMFCIIFIYL